MNNVGMLVADVNVKKQTNYCALRRPFFEAQNQF